MKIARPACCAAALLASLASVNTIAQVPPPPAPPPLQGSQQFPPVPQAPFPQQLPGQPPTFDPNNPAGTSPRFLFAGALALVAKSVGASVVNGLSQGIVNWFNKRTGQIGATPPGAAPWMGPPPMGSGMAGAYTPGALPSSLPPGSSTPWLTPPPTGADVGAAYPPGSVPPIGGGIAGTYPPGSLPASVPTTYPPPAGVPGPAGGVMPGMLPGTPMTAGSPSGALPQPLPTQTPTFAAAGMPPLPGAMPAGVVPALYAGIAFEVHLVGAGGIETTVDPASYIFHSGDRFLVYYRPSLPGRVHVSNVSPTSEVIPIETLTLAAGELAKLGPYQLTDPAGDEALRLVLEPCSTPELVTATRNIVKATDTAPGSGLHISSCQNSSQPAAGLATRNIVKASMDGNTGFALDPVNSQELASGRLAPRETSIAIHHR